MASVEERLKLKRGQVDTWSTREKLCLASCVVQSGNQNWMSVSRNLRLFGGEPGRPSDWFSQKSCAVQYDNLLTHIETPKRKKRGADGTKTDGPDLTPAQVILKQLTLERVEELKKQMVELRAVYMKVKDDLILVDSGQADDKLEEMLQQIQEEKRRKEAEQEENARWIRQREERKQELELAWRPQQHLRNSNMQGNPALQSQPDHTARRASSQSEISSEAESNVDSPINTDQIIASDEALEVKPAPTPTSPLLTSLLKSPSPVTAPQSSSILHSAITSQRGASPTITSLLNSSPSIPSGSTSLPVSPNIKSLVSNALAGHDDVPKPSSHTSNSASGSPTLSMLLELPPSAPGQPLPELPYSTTKQPASSPVPSSTDSTTPLKAATSATIKTESTAKEPLPDLGNMEIVLPIETEVKVSEAESKLNLDSGELQDLSNSDLELVMDPGMDDVLEELVPEGLVEEMSVFIEVSSEDVETSVNNILEATEQMENGNIAATNGDEECSVKKEMLQEISCEQQEEVEMVESDSSKSTSQPGELDLKDENEDLSSSNETLSREALENASIVIVQDNGELVKLQDGVETAHVIGDIQIIQDTSSSDVVVVVPLENVEEEAVKEGLPSVPTSEVEQSPSSSEENDADKTSEKDEGQIEERLPGKKPHKIEKQNVNLEEGPVATESLPPVNTPYNENLSNLSKNVDVVESPVKVTSPISKEDTPSVTVSKNKESTKQTETPMKLSDATIPKEGKRRKSLTFQRKDKTSGVADHTSEVILEQPTIKKGEAEAKRDSDIPKEEKQQEIIESTNIGKENKSGAPPPENPTVHIKEEKLVRSDTPSTEDDKSRDADQSTPLVTKPRRGRLARDSAAYSDSVPNSPTPSSTPTDEEKDYRVWKKSIMLVYGRIAAHKNASIFLRPITDDKAPGYSQMIYRPIDLFTIKKNVETGITRTTDEFQRDILLMFNNAIMYNKSGTPVHDMALEMQEEGVKHLKEYVNTQLLVRGAGSDSGHIPSRRGTRTAEKREQDSDGFISRRGLGERNSVSRGGTPVSANLGKRKRSFPDDKSTPKRRKDDD